MANYCLPKELTGKFLESLKNGAIEPGKLAEMTSAERHAELAKTVGEEHARDVNALFESKMLLKNQQQGMIRWAKKIGGLTTEARRDIVARIQKMDRILDAKSQERFLNDLADQKLGTNVTFEEAKQIADFSHKLSAARVKISPDEPLGSPNRLDYGAKKVALQNLVSDLKLTNTPGPVKSFVGTVKKNPLTALTDAASKGAGFAKSVKASLDNSFFGRQGFKTIFTHPQQWVGALLKSFVDIGRQLKNKTSNNSVIDGLKAEVLSRPNAIDGTYDKMKLAIGTGEEAYPTTFPEKIPLLGRLFKASEVAYTAAGIRLRADIADKYLDIARQTGVDLNKNELQSIGKLVNSLTGRGYLGSLEKVANEVNTIFFSPRMLKSSFDFLTAHQLQKDVSPFVRKQAAVNLVKVIAGATVIMAVARALNPDSVELDPTSADFGKIRVGDTRFDITGGMGSLMTLVARQFTGTSKSSSTGKVTSLTSGKFGMPTRLDVALSFFENKLSPSGAVIKDLLKGQDFDGNKPTLIGEAKNLYAPLAITNIEELMTNPNAANPLVAELLDAFGISTNTYSPKKK